MTAGSVSLHSFGVAATTTGPRKSKLAFLGTEDSSMRAAAARLRGSGRGSEDGDVSNSLSSTISSSAHILTFSPSPAVSTTLSATPTPHQPSHCPPPPSSS